MPEWGWPNPQGTARPAVTPGGTGGTTRSHVRAVTRGRRRNATADVALPRTAHHGLQRTLAGCLPFRPVPLHLLHRPQDARLGQHISQLAVNRPESLYRLIPLRLVAQIKSRVLGDGPQILRQPLLFRRRTARTLAHPGQHRIAADVERKGHQQMRGMAAFRRMAILHPLDLAWRQHLLAVLAATRVADEARFGGKAGQLGAQPPCRIGLKITGAWLRAARIVCAGRAIPFAEPETLLQPRSKSFGATARTASARAIAMPRDQRGQSPVDFQGQGSSPVAAHRLHLISE